MHVALTFRFAVVVTASLLGFFACGSSTSSTTPINDATTGSGGLTGTGGNTAGSGGVVGSGGTKAGTGGTTASTSTVANFSFFVTSYAALQKIAGNTKGLGGDLRHGETGAGAGLRGADKICTEIAESSLAGAGTKTWRAFLSATADESGKQVNAIERIGSGPWYDRIGRLFANNLSELYYDRPQNADAAIKNDFPNETGTTNQNPDKTGDVDNHDMLTGSNAQGQLYSATATCKDWTVADGASSNGQPRVGHSWPTDGQQGCSDSSSSSDASMGGGIPGMDMDGGITSMGGGIPGMDMDGGIPGMDMDGGITWTGGGITGMDMDGGITSMGGGIPGMDGGDPSMGGGGMGGVCNWMSALDESGCAPGVNLIQNGGPGNNGTVGSGGGYGGFYCFALTP
jgi:hypothetical protein